MKRKGWQIVTVAVLILSIYVAALAQLTISSNINFALFRSAGVKDDTTAYGQKENLVGNMVRTVLLDTIGPATNLEVDANLLRGIPLLAYFELEDTLPAQNYKKGLIFSMSTFNGGKSSERYTAYCMTNGGTFMNWDFFGFPGVNVEFFDDDSMAIGNRFAIAIQQSTWQ